MNQTQTAVVYKPAVTPSISPELIEYDTIIISDIHLGSPLCQAKELSEFLQQIRVKQLILAGDIFDDLKFQPCPAKGCPRLTDVAWCLATNAFTITTSKRQEGIREPADCSQSTHAGSSRLHKPAERHSYLRVECFLAKARAHGLGQRVAVGLFSKKPSDGVEEIVLPGNQRSQLAFDQRIAGAGDIKAECGRAARHRLQERDPETFSG